jgi:hypothetical protein
MMEITEMDDSESVVLEMFVGYTKMFVIPHF